MSNDDERSVDRATRFAGSFEAELLLELMLRYWEHPFADDEEFRASLLDSVAGVLLASADGKQLISEVPADDMSFVAAVWYVESTSKMDEGSNLAELRSEWLSRLRRAVPSCFCAEDDLF